MNIDLDYLADGSKYKSQKNLVQNFLNQLFPEEEEYAKIMKVLRSGAKKTPSDKLNIFYGTGGNGKSLLCELIARTFDKDVVRLPSNYFFRNEELDYEESESEDGIFWKKRFDVGEKSFLICHDSNIMDWDISFIKHMIGDKIQVYINEHYELVKQTGQVILVTNTIPTIEDDLSMKKRLNVIHFKSSFMDDTTNTKIPEFRSDLLLDCCKVFRDMIENYVD